MLKALLKRQEGFTLIELLAVMAIVSVLSGIVAIQVSGSGDTSKDTQTKQDATTVGTAVADYFSSQEGASIEIPSTVTVFDEEGIEIKIDSKWPEIPITANLAYGNVFQETTSQIAAISLFDQEGNPSVLSVRGLLEGYNAVDFFALLDGGFLQSAPDGAVLFTKTFSNYLWLLKKESTAGGGGTVSSREVEVFKLVTVRQGEGLDLDVLAYRRLTGETIVNEIPVASPDSVKAGLDTPLAITLTGSDKETCDLAFTIVEPPANGTLSVVSDADCVAGDPTNTDSATVTYTANDGFSGKDSFTFLVNDGTEDSAPRSVDITVEA